DTAPPCPPRRARLHDVDVRGPRVTGSGDPHPPDAGGPPGRSRQLHGARAGEMAHAAAGRRRRSARDAGVSVPMAVAVLHRLDARARGDAPDSARVPTRRADAPAHSYRTLVVRFLERDGAAPGLRPRLVRDRPPRVWVTSGTRRLAP